MLSSLFLIIYYKELHFSKVRLIFKVCIFDVNKSTDEHLIRTGKFECAQSIKRKLWVSSQRNALFV